MCVGTSDARPPQGNSDSCSSRTGDSVPMVVLSTCGLDCPGTSCHSWLMFPCTECVVRLGFAGNSDQSRLRALRDRR